MDPKSNHSSKDDERAGGGPRNRKLPNIWQRLDEHLPSWNNWESTDHAAESEEPGGSPQSTVVDTPVEKTATAYRLRSHVIPSDPLIDAVHDGPDGHAQGTPQEFSIRDGRSQTGRADGGSREADRDDIERFDIHTDDGYEIHGDVRHQIQGNVGYANQGDAGYENHGDAGYENHGGAGRGLPAGSDQHPEPSNGAWLDSQKPDAYEEQERGKYEPKKGEEHDRLHGKRDEVRIAEGSESLQGDNDKRLIAEGNEDQQRKGPEKHEGEEYALKVPEGYDPIGDDESDDYGVFRHSSRLSGDGFSPGEKQHAADGSTGAMGYGDTVDVGPRGRVASTNLAEEIGGRVAEIADRADGGAADTADQLDVNAGGFTNEASTVEAQDVHSPGYASDPVEGDLIALNLRDRVVIMLLFKQIVQFEMVEKAWRKWQKKTGGKSKEVLWRVLTMDSSFDREQIFAEAAQVYAFKQAEIENAGALQFIKKHQGNFAETEWERMRELRVVPIRHEAHSRSKEKRVIFVSHDPTRPEVSRLMGDLTLESYELQYASETQIDRLLALAFPKRNEYLDRVSNSEFALDLGTSYDQETSLVDESALEAEISRSSLINLFEASLVEAVRRGVSDIHIFPNPRKQIEIYFRVDGDLELWHCEERVPPEAFLAVVKDNTLNVDRFERDAAQDGFIQRKIDDTLIRYRVSVLPVANANQELRSESVVIRVLDDRNVITDLRKLGLLDRARETFEWAISQPYGMVILTGPTGSGKTTTLFAALSQVVTPKRNVLTVEDPVEYVIPGVRQIKLSHKLVLEQALRSILRHDPDIVMVGEMRDRETAELAIKLANTGHLTFSTLHTNDAPSAISRLYKMGIEPFLIAYAINLIVAQRLVRTLCSHCKRPDEMPDHEMLARLGFTPQELATTRFYVEGHNPKCQTCGGSGFKGRRAITETMAFSHEIRRLIVTADRMIDEDAIRQQAISEGMLTLRGSAREIVMQGELSITELIRTTAGEQ